jgi:TolB-like protein/DNA-binding winged helix-turn-helix (wHTH) protein/Flp pilus assembly protein TadD
MDSSGPVTFVFEGFRLDLVRRRLTDPDGNPIPVSGRAFDVLAYLVNNRTRVVGKDELLSAVWSRVVVEENNLNQAIRNLRKLLGDSREFPRFISTVASRGYQFIAPTRVEASDPGMPLGRLEPATRPDVLAPAAASAPMPGGMRSRRWLLLAGAAAAAGVAGATWWLRETQSPSGLPKSIAVLPFNPLLKTAANPAIELGITESLINRLGMLSEVIVLPFSSVRRFAGTAIEPLQAARELGVASVLDGHVQIDQNRLRATARLLDAGNGRSLWSGRFNEPLDDFFIVQESLAEQVVRGLALELSPEQRVRLARRDTVDRDAWQLYLNGRYQFRLRTEAGLLKALDFYEAATRHDPAFALPRAGIADVLSFQGVFGMRPPEAVFPRADFEAQLAAELDQELAEAFLSLGHVKVQFYRMWREGERLYRHSLSLRPEQARGKLLLANCLMIQGRIEEALAESRRSHTMEPADVTFAANLGMLLMFSRKLDLAYEHLTGLFGTTPDSPLPRHHLARLHILRGEPLQAIALLENYEGRAPGAFSNLGRAYALAGRTSAARAEIGRLNALGAKGFGVGFDAALIHAALGEKEAALTALELGLRDFSQMMLFLNSEPGLDSLRDEPRFRAVVARLGLS